MNEFEKQAFLNSLWQAARARAAAAGPAVKAFGQGQAAQARTIGSGLKAMGTSPRAGMKTVLGTPLARNGLSVVAGGVAGNATDSNTTGAATALGAGAGLKALARRL